MSDALTFFVPGTPLPKQSTRFDGNGHAHTDPRIKAWQNTVAQMARLSFRGDPDPGPVEVGLIFIRPRASADIDNLSKLVLDGLQGVIFKDDKQVMELHLRKVFNRKMAPGVWITVAPYRPEGGEI